MNAYLCTRILFEFFFFSIPFMNLYFILLKARQLPSTARLNANRHWTSALFPCLTASVSGSPSSLIQSVDLHSGNV